MTDGMRHPDAPPPLACAEVTVRYPGQDRDALHGVSLAVPAGAITAVVGPNGSGKSTIVRALLRRVPLQGGTITVRGRPLAAWGHRALAREVAVVPQREEPTMPLRVDEFVALGCHPRRSTFGALAPADRQLVDEAMARAGVAWAALRRIDTLSGGEWQRVRIARALAQQAPVLVCDEPTTFLDIAHEMALFELLDELASEGRAVLLVSHQLNLVARFAAQLVLLHQGRVAASGSAHEVMRGEVLEQVYGWPLVVTRDPAVGAPALVPLRGRARRGDI
jgi:iron complex transport system ATP-binding protein